MCWDRPSPGLGVCRDQGSGTLCPRELVPPATPHLSLGVWAVPSPPPFPSHRHPCPLSPQAALNMLTRCQSLRYREDGVLCVALHPGWVQTDMGDAGSQKVSELLATVWKNLFVWGWRVRCGLNSRGLAGLWAALRQVMLSGVNGGRR